MDDWSGLAHAACASDDDDDGDDSIGVAMIGVALPMLQSGSVPVQHSITCTCIIFCLFGSILYLREDFFFLAECTCV